MAREPRAARGEPGRGRLVHAGADGDRHPRGAAGDLGAHADPLPPGRWRDGCAYMAERSRTPRWWSSTLPDVSTWTDPRVLDDVQRFLAEGRVDAAPERVLTTVLFTDIVDSTSRAAELGDGAGASCSRRTTPRCGPSSPATAARRSAARATGSSPPSRARARDRVRPPHHRGVAELGLDIRAGVHTGRGRARRRQGGGHRGAHRRAIAAEARPCEVLVSSIVRDLAAGSGIDFEDRGVRQLKGVPGEWQLFAARLSDRAGIR